MSKIEPAWLSPLGTTAYISILLFVFPCTIYDLEIMITSA